MLKIERNFIRLAIDYLIHAKDKDIYSSDREEYLNVALSILDTLIEEDSDYAEKKAIE